MAFAHDVAGSGVLPVRHPLNQQRLLAPRLVCRDVLGAVRAYMDVVSFVCAHLEIWRSTISVMSFLSVAAGYSRGDVFPWCHRLPSRLIALRDVMGGCSTGFGCLAGPTGSIFLFALYKAKFCVVRVFSRYLPCSFRFGGYSDGAAKCYHAWRTVLRLEFEECAGRNSIALTEFLNCERLPFNFWCRSHACLRRMARTVGSK